MNLPTGTVTFLMTDIEGSTKLWELHPEAMRETLARHDSIADSVVIKHEGTLVKSRGEGDSLFIVFLHTFILFFMLLRLAGHLIFSSAGGSCGTRSIAGS